MRIFARCLKNLFSNWELAESSYQTFISIRLGDLLFHNKKNIVGQLLIGLIFLDLNLNEIDTFCF